MNGLTVGAVANRSKVYNEEAEVVAEFDGSLTADGAEKAADFVRFCDAFRYSGADSDQCIRICSK